MNEKMSFKMGAKFAALFYIWVRIFSIYDMNLCVKVPEVNYDQFKDELNQ